jgi:hypothetical protein
MKTAESVSKMFAALAQAEMDRKSEVFTNEQKLECTGNGQLQLNVEKYSSYVKTGRLFPFVIKAAEENAEMLLKRAKELEEENYQFLLRKSKEYSIEFTTGMKIETSKDDKH